MGCERVISYIDPALHRPEWVVATAGGGFTYMTESCPCPTTLRRARRCHVVMAGLPFSYILPNAPKRKKEKDKDKEKGLKKKDRRKKTKEKGQKKKGKRKGQKKKDSLVVRPAHFHLANPALRGSGG